MAAGAAQAQDNGCAPRTEIVAMLAEREKAAKAHAEMFAIAAALVGLCIAQGAALPEAIAAE